MRDVGFLVAARIRSANNTCLVCWNIPGESTTEIRLLIHIQTIVT